MKIRSLLILLVFPFLLYSGKQDSLSVYFKTLLDEPDTNITNKAFTDFKNSGQWYYYYALKSYKAFDQRDFQLVINSSNAAFLYDKDQNIDLTVNLIHKKGVANIYINELDSAITCFFKEIEYEKERDTLINQPNAYSNLSICYRRLNILDSAIYYGKKALKLYSQIDDIQGIARTENNLGNLFRDLDFTTALKHYDAALTIYKQLNDNEKIAILENNIGYIFVQTKQYIAAIDYLKRSNDYFTANHKNAYLLLNLNNLGYALMNNDNYNLAEKYLLKALNTNKLEDETKVSTLLNLGIVKNFQKKYFQAEKYFLEALSISNKTTIAKRIIREIYYHLILNSIAQNKTTELKEYFVTYDSLAKTLNLEESKKELARFEAELDIEKTHSLLILANKEKRIKNEEIARNKTEIQLKNQILFTSVLGILLLLVFLYFTYKIALKRKELNQIIAKQKFEVEKQNLKLEKEVEARTIQLEKALEKAEESNRLKSAFLANISHEIRTPLNSIMGFSEILSYEDVDKETLKSSSLLIRNNSYALLRIINDIVDVSRIEAEQFYVDINEFSYFDLIENIETKHYDKAELFGKNHIEFYTSFDRYSDVNLISDYDRLLVVFEKLIDNAFQYTEKGFVEIGSEYENNKIIFYIKDSGIGIPDERLIQIFENFKKYRTDTNLKYKGLGVGLFIANFILQALHSKLNVVSLENKGTIFSFAIPFSKKE
ncbi:MAG: tetratricopeptide repeat-containing sensor histidine kinase [Bacteroidales bacterium]|nr:tetratricopeptide repeat-containing sensor histidine kinase [Bacteroidales bacterium]